MNGKQRLIHILLMLQRETDEEHPLSTPEIVEHFTRMGMVTDRKTVREDIKTLIGCGINIVVSRDNVTRYFYDDRPFELPELKLLVDAVESSKFITASKSHKLVQKLTAMTSEGNATELKRHLHMDGRIKPENENIYYAVDTIFRAINQRKKISFQYYEYTPEKKRVPRHDGEPFVYSPYSMLYLRDNYYMLGYWDLLEKVAPLRVNRMGIPELLDEPAHPKPRDFDPANYTVSIYNMYSGETMQVRMLCKNNIMDHIIDRFGSKISTAIVDTEHFTVDVTVSVSPTFFSWVFQFGGGIKILGPEKAVEQYREMLEVAL